MVETLAYDESLRQTNELLKQQNATIYEAAIQFDDLFVRVDILIKRGDSLEIIEVKSKSFDPHEDDAFYNKTELKKGNRKLNQEWLPYLEDIAFQTYATQKSFPNLKVIPYLMLVDKSSQTSVEGLNQLFLIKENKNGRSQVLTKTGTDKKSVGKQILCQIPVRQEVDLILASSAEFVGPFRRRQLA